MGIWTLAEQGLWNGTVSVCLSTGPQQQSCCYRFAAVGPAFRRYGSIAAALAGKCGQCNIVGILRQLNTRHRLQLLLLLLLLLQPCNGLFSRTTWLSWHQKGNTSLDLNKASDDGIWGWQWHQLDHMQTIYTSVQTDNHTNTSSLNFLQAGRSSWHTTNSVKAISLVEKFHSKQNIPCISESFHHHNRLKLWVSVSFNNWQILFILFNWNMPVRFTAVFNLDKSAEFITTANSQKSLTLHSTAWYTQNKSCECVTLFDIVLCSIVGKVKLKHRVNKFITTNAMSSVWSKSIVISWAGLKIPRVFN